MEDEYKLLGLVLAIAFMIIIGVSLVSSSSTSVECAGFNESYTTFEPYTTYDYGTVWGSIYQKILDKVNILVPSDRPAFISYNLCAPCKYNITFISSLPTNFYIFDQYDDERYFEGESALPLVFEASSEYQNFSFDSPSKGLYYFVFDRSFQGTARNDPATGELIIYELKGVNQSTLLAKYREITKYRNVTRCQ